MLSYAIAVLIISSMWDLEAKDLLVQQTAEQAALEKIPLSDVEKRMMYFTETGEMRENAIDLNDAFEAEYDTEQYETKISKLMHHAHARIRKEDPEAARQWSEAIRQLSKGDHYVLILCKEGSTELPRNDVPKQIVAVVLAAVLLVGLLVVLSAVGGPYGFHWRGQKPPMTTELVPLWVQRSIICLMIGAYVYWGILPLISDKLQIHFPQFFSKVFKALKKRKSAM
jgi:hypothetical protein